jgi:hypothetical protein
MSAGLPISLAVGAHLTEVRRLKEQQNTEKFRMFLARRPAQCQLFQE